MSDLTNHSNHSLRRQWWAIPLALIVIALLAASWRTSAGASASVALGGPAGKPAAGPPAALQVVDLRHLPPDAGGHSGHAGTLPFRAPHGLVAPPNFKATLNPGATGAAPFTFLNIITGFNGINSEVSGGSGGPCGCVPPDGDMAIGPSHVIVGVNQAFQVFSKTGVTMTLPIGYDTFFGSCGATGLTSSDPVTVYDPVADRFTVGILRYANQAGPSYVSVAVSRSSDPTGMWNKYCFEQPYQGLPSLYDFPHISVGQDAIFTTGNIFPAGSQQSTAARVNAYPKQQMYAGAITVTQLYTDVVLNSDMTTADTLRPVLFNRGLPSPTNYFINAEDAPGMRVSLWRWTLPFSTNNFMAAGGVDVAPYAPPVSMLQPPPGQPMPPPGYIDARTLAGMWYSNTVYSAHTIGCTSGTTTNCIQWYQVGGIDGTPTLLQQGIVGGAANESRSYPNLAIDRNGSVELAYAYSSSNDFIGIRHSARLAGDPAGTMSGESTIKAGEMAEVGYNALRWGDYSGSVLDPSDGLTLWHFEEYAQNINDPLGSWGTWASASRIRAGGLPTSTPAATATGTPPTVTSSATAATATTCTISYSDVLPGSTFYAYIKCLTCKGIVSGYSDGTFRPGN
ncbi:MAG: S-layer homology domain-containing protein, partial [Actinomycetota bacterium]|nr:S-layer homology domain-containing protein [Actinomycetota bacterium]